MNPADFIAAVAPAARRAMAASGIPASFTIAEGALESGWGIAAPGNNLFGVKADALWRGAVTAQRTREFVGGAWVAATAVFRAYPDWQGCIDDHAAFLLENPRYRACFARPALDGERFAQAVAAAGYATDPAYADKLIATMRAHGLSRFDQPA